MSFRSIVTLAVLVLGVGWLWLLFYNTASALRIAGGFFSFLFSVAKGLVSFISDFISWVFRRRK